MKETQRYAWITGTIFFMTLLLFILGDYIQAAITPMLPELPPTSTLPSISLTSSIPTLPFIHQAIAKENLTCFFGNGAEYDITIPRFQIVMVVGKDSTGNWILVRSEEFADCWVETPLLNLQGDINSLPVITTSLPPIITPTPITTRFPTFIPAPIELRWKVIKYECDSQENITNVTIDLDISGGIPPYTSSPPLPINALPEQSLSIKVSSGTIDGKPSKIISFTVPRSSDFRCRSSGNNPGPVLPPPPSFGSTRCYDGKDNDGDGLTDYPADLGCFSYHDDTER